MTSVKLEKFEGPLDLLLQLIEEEKLPITAVAVAQVTDHFFKHLSSLGENRSAELADFLVIATRLVYLKSRELLPYLYPEPDEGPSLADQLKLYKRYADASHDILARWENGGVAYGRAEPVATVPRFNPPDNAGPADLRAAFTALLVRLKPLAALPQVTIDRAISVRQKIEQIYNALKQFRKIHFKDIIANAASRTEVIVSFLALLELVKRQEAVIDQPAAFAEMMIKKV